MKRCLQIHPADNVATLLDDAAGETVQVLGVSGSAPVEVTAAVSGGHKVALREIGAGEAVVKYGVAIGVATRNIARGEWVHLQNCRSRFDERSASFDVETGAATDTAYE